MEYFFGRLFLRNIFGSSAKKGLLFLILICISPDSCVDI